VRLEHRFRVAAPIEEVWSALLDPSRVAPCMPGATLDGVSDDSFTGTVKVKLGPVTLLYKGTGSFEATDAASRRAVIKASGKDSRGNGTAAATVEVTLSADSGGTVAHVVTDLSVTGRPAQFGRGMITEVGGRILDQFAECLAGKLALAEQSRVGGDPAEKGRAGESPAGEGLAGETPAEESPAAAAPSVADADSPRSPSAATVPSPAPRSLPSTEAEPLDLLRFAGTSVAKRAVVVIALAVLLIVVVGRLRRR
jgi:carbon monoxide dehydrogenase subunit G